mmetsp:Transcript_30308/g.47457  ORF Transcript_30308/g.47457 Transcript_30308/m.47457 type:complete len:385 (+) Transcript_30308:3627-4781(+)
MAHRKYEAPRHGSLGFLPRKRCRKKSGKIRSFPKDNPLEKCHLTASLGYKAGMTHVVREVISSGSKNSVKDRVESVSVIETPPIKIMGVIGYIRTPNGLKSFKTVWSNSLDDSFIRNYYKNWHKSKKKAFSRHRNLDLGRFENLLDDNFGKIKKYCTTLRCLVSSQVNFTNLLRKKSNLIEVQVNGGDMEEKVEFCKKIIGTSVSICNIFSEGQKVDIIGITKGKGFQGVINRWGVTKLPRKTHRGARRVACVGAWSPSRVSFTVPRAGQMGYHHRTHKNSIIYKVLRGNDLSNATTDSDPTPKSINPMGGFPFYGIIKSDSILLKGNTIGVKRRVITIRKTIRRDATQSNFEPVNLKFIDTSSKFGHGRYQTTSEKKNFKGQI